MLKVNIADKMRCPLRVQYRKDILFNPIKDCFAAQKHTPFETQPNNIYFHYIHLVLDFEFKILPNIDNYEYIPLNRFDIFPCVRSSAILQLRFNSQISKCYASRDPTISLYRRCFFLSSAMWYTHSSTLYSTLYRTDMPTWRGKPLMTEAMCGAMLLIHHTIRSHWFINSQPSNVISPFLTS